MSRLEHDTVLAGRRALVTGAASGIGAAVADTFETAGATVIRCDIKASRTVLACDVSNESSVDTMFADIARQGAIDDVVHAAGIVELGSIAETSLARFRHVIDVNLIGTFLVARAAGRYLRAGGNLVLVASQAGLKGGAMWGAYSASKGGVLRLADCLVGELAAQGVRVNSISPGNVQTAMMTAALDELARRKGTTAEALRHDYEQEIPLRRFASAEEVARAALALCSPLLSYANGINLVLDGGELSR